MENNTNPVYAQIIRRFTSFLLDLFATNMLFILSLYVLTLFYKIDIINKIYSDYFSSVGTGTTTLSNSAMNLEIQLFFGYMFAFLAYNLLCIVIFHRSLGMLTMNIFYLSADHAGNPKLPTFPQRILRGVLCNALALLALFIPCIVWPFDQYRRSLNDRISGILVMQSDMGKSRTIAAYIIIAIFILLFAYVNGIV